MQYFKGNPYRDESAFKENPFHNSIFFFFFCHGLELYFRNNKKKQETHKRSEPGGEGETKP